MNGEILRTTRTKCPECNGISDAVLVESDGRVLFRGTCPEHGPWESIFASDAALYRKLTEWHPTDVSVPTDGFSRDWSAFAPIATTCTIDVTTRCNLRCPDCFSDAGAAGDEPTVDEILGFLPPKSPGFNPNISLVGGESILRKDIDQIIAGIIAKGFVPRLNSNGKGLLDRELLTRLQKAGLRWIILQFDGFSPETSVRFRGEDLIEHKIEVIRLLAEYGINVHFAVMVMAGVNDREVGDILRFAAKTPNVRRVSFYPRSDVGRNPQAGPVTDLSDMIRALEQASGGNITENDILAHKQLFDIAFRLTKNPVFRNRNCLLPFIVYSDGNELIPANRVLLPGLSAKHWKGLLKLAATLPALWAFDKGGYSSSFLPVSIENFYATRAFDVTASANCHQVYLTRHGYIPFCLYNSFFRDRSGSGC